MSITKMAVTTIMLMMTLEVISVDFLLRANVPYCTIIMSSFDHIKVQVAFPAIGSKQEDQKFKIDLINENTRMLVKQIFSQDNKIFRSSFELDSNVVYSLCFTFVTRRRFGPDDVIFIGYKAEQNFEDRIGKLQIPKELANEENLKIMYQTSRSMIDTYNQTIHHQAKQRQLQDKLVDLSLHKANRIITMTVIECIVIIISGFYQIFALRKFLIDKNLY